MTIDEAIRILKLSIENSRNHVSFCFDNKGITALNMAIQALEQESIDKSAMMHEIYMEGVNMSGEYQGCWVRFKDIEKIVDKYMGDKE